MLLVNKMEINIKQIKVSKKAWYKLQELKLKYDKKSIAEVINDLLLLSNNNMNKKG